MKNKDIYLYTPISNKGHLNSWHVLLAKNLVKAGYNVVAIAKNNNDLKYDQKLTCLNLGYVFNFYNFIISFTSFKIIKYYELDYFKNVISFANIILNKKPDLIINTYLECYDAKDIGWVSFLNKEGFYFCGIVFNHQKNFIKESNFIKNTNFKGALVTNPELNSNKVFPIADISNVDFYSQSSHQKEILKAAGKRTIVLMAGAINSHKNIKLWKNIIEQSDGSKFYFVQMGKVESENLDYEDFCAYKLLTQLKLENLYIIDKFIEDEAEFNSIFKVADIIYCIYKNFNRTSNILYKAAFYNIPVISNNNSLMSSVVMNYQIGYTFNENDDLENILSLLNRFPHWDINICGFKKYLEDHSVENFIKPILDLIESN